MGDDTIQEEELHQAWRRQLKADLTEDSAVKEDVVEEEHGTKVDDDLPEWVKQLLRDEEDALERKPPSRKFKRRKSIGEDYKFITNKRMCSGCGAKFHSNSPDLPGYLHEEALQEILESVKDEKPQVVRRNHGERMPGFMTVEEELKEIMEKGEKDWSLPEVQASAREETVRRQPSASTNALSLPGLEGMNADKLSGRRLNEALSDYELEELLAGGTSQEEVTQSRFSIWVGGLPFSTKKKQVEAFFEDCGDLESIQMPLVKGGRRKGECIGYAFVSYKTSNAMTKALELNGTYFNGNPILVEQKGDRQPEEIGDATIEDMAEKDPQMVEALYDLPEEELQELGLGLSAQDVGNSLLSKLDGDISTKELNEMLSGVGDEELDNILSGGQEAVDKFGFEVVSDDEIQKLIAEEGLEASGLDLAADETSDTMTYIDDLSPQELEALGVTLDSEEDEASDSLIGDSQKSGRFGYLQEEASKHLSREDIDGLGEDEPEDMLSEIEEDFDVELQQAEEDSQQEGSKDSNGKATDIPSPEEKNKAMRDRKSVV